MSTAQSILKKYWGYDHFRPMQAEIIESVLNRQDTLALLPTGSGKSICYQIPPLAKPGLTLVVSPLIALMQDQVRRLKKQGIMAAAIHAGMNFAQVKQTLDNMLHGPFKMLFVSPERLQTDLFQEYLPELDINLIAVDEAHCISQWGHDFRPDYLKIASVREVFPDVPVLALTASATPEVQEDIALQLKLNRPAIFRQSFERTNIFYEVKYSENKTGDMLAALQMFPGTAIIYCRSRKQTENLTKTLQQQQFKALAYHAGLPRDRREAAQEAWMNNEATIMVATTAFGMGIDKSDVRLVIHYDAPEHLEAWYQEAGRAGRDGKPSKAITLYNYADGKRLKMSIDTQFPPETFLRKVYQSVAEYLQIATGTEPDQYYPFDLADFAAKFKLEALPASYALKLLGQDGLWTMSDSVRNPATIQFTAERAEIDNLYRHYPDLGYIAISLLRQYNGIFQHPVTIRLAAIANQLKMPQAKIEQAIIQLHRMGMLEYRQPKEGPQLFFHHYRVDSRHLLINHERIRRLRERHEARTKVMIQFLEQQTICRDRILLSYFGEQPGKDCGHCDVCQSKEKKDPIILSAKLLLNYLQNIEKTTIAQLQQHFHQPALIDLLRELSDNGNIDINDNEICLRK
ncbi:RecQ family ATP-dependent DNA helicase [Taibaiella soli]|uniref:ATP-dependent DNA helicase RecQ n=1 Tax=Taibaiella soli TaxID=1649169 RepID=A0A2W2A764_9BACT|nr:ATP-dependent DNA helicase RecQ [Taibaiella soli]PZF71155.1 RecQ family ATP-dependent DNA helicase [Taibaiella soli]